MKAANHSVTDKERAISQKLIAEAVKTPEDIFAELKSGSNGISVDEAKDRLKRYGYNTVAHKKLKPWYIQLLAAFNSPFNFVLFALAAVSFATRDYTGTSIIVVMVTASVFIKFFQEYKSAKNAEALRKMIHTNCTVIRKDQDGNPVNFDIPLEEIVPGDIVRLAAGDIIPADIRIIQSRSLFVSQSALTGESLPIEKSADTLTPDNARNALDLKNTCYMGTSVNNGMAAGIVLSTGTSTYFGSMAESLENVANPTSFDIGINKVSWLLISFMTVMVPVVFFVIGFTKGDWIQAMIFALSVAVSLTPEMLPMIVTSNLAKGAARMAKQKVIVKKLSAIQDFGAMDILCTDKTGTLTEDRIVLMKHTNVFLDDNMEALRYAYLNSYFEKGLKNVMDMAIANTEHLDNKEEVIKGWRSVDELPFDFDRRRMSVILKNNDRQVLICKGAVEEMLKCSAKVNADGTEKEITPELEKTILDNTAQLNREGLRVIAVGHKVFSADHPADYTIDDECDLIMDGFMSFLDPPKESAKEALEALSASGIRAVVLTGDNDVITAKVCSEVGMTDEKIIKGSDIENLSDEELSPLLEQHRIFAKLSPMQKARIVSLMRKNGHTVGYMGDGINDAVSLREADIGISVDTAVDIAKENADIVLLQKSLMVLNQGVVEGRKMFANTMKYIKITASSNLGNALSLLGASILFPFLPMLPIQILILNMVYDFSQIAIPWDNVDPEYLAKPRKWIASDIKRFMLVMGPLNALFDYMTFAVLFFILGASTVGRQSLFQTGFFIENLFAQAFIIWVLRTEKIPFLQSKPSKQLFFSSLALIAGGTWLSYSGIGAKIGFYPLPVNFYYWLAGILSLYFISAQVVKRWYIRRFENWI